MAVIKCKMCGGNLEILEGSTVCECEYCGTRQTVPSSDNEKKLTLFGRAGRLLRACEFDKAAGVFESIVSDFPEEAEAYWGLVLCKYGIEYVDDPTTGKKIPTCHRSSFDSVLDDPNFQQACENTDAVARRVYREEARQIEELRQAILQVSGKEEPYDIFISYKETDENGERTLDSVLAQDIYKELTNEGYRVFFSRISLEDKLGSEYEPYIFAALNSAKVMLVVGTDYENFEAIWVKNEWSRFLKLIASGQKKTLIPVFKNMDPYDMPKEFAKLQAQNMGKIGAMQDLVRGVKKLLGKKQDETASAQSPYAANGTTNMAVLLDRGVLSLEDGDWNKAKELFDQVLNSDSRCGEAYLGLAMAEARTTTRDTYAKKYTSANSVLRTSRFAARARQFDPKLEDWFLRLDAEGKEADETERKIQEEAQKVKEAELREQQKKLEEAQRVKEAELSRWRIRAEEGNRLFSAGVQHSLGIGFEGTVYAIGLNTTGRTEVQSWNSWQNRIVAVFAGVFVSFGLLDNGEVVITPFRNSQDFGQTDVSGWDHIVKICSYDFHTIGLRSDGTAVATNILVSEDDFGQSKVSEWTDLTDISANTFHTLGLKKDGTVVACGGKSSGRCNVGEWSNIVAICASREKSFGLKADGTVVMTEFTAMTYPDVFAKDNAIILSWKDIVFLSAGRQHLVALRKDGTVFSAGSNKYGQCDVSGWRNIVTVSAGAYHTLGLRSDGTVLSTNIKATPDGSKDFGQTKVENWKLFLTEEEFNRRKNVLIQEKEDLQHEISTIKGMFAESRKEKMKARITEIKEELFKLERMKHN